MVSTVLRRWILKGILLRMKTQIGLDIQPQSVRAVALQIHPTEEATFLRSAEVALPSGALQAHHWIKTAAIGTGVQQALQQLALPGAGVILAMPQGLVMQKVLLLEKTLHPLEIEQHLKLEALHYFGYPATELCIDFSVIAEKTKMHQQKIQAIAARREEVFKRIRILQAMGIKIKAMDIESHAIVRATAHSLSFTNIVLIYCQTETVLFLIMQQQQLVAVREIATEAFTTSSMALIETIEHQLQLFRVSHIGVFPEQIAWIVASDEIALLLKDKRDSAVKIISPCTNMSSSLTLAYGLALWR